MLLGLIVFIWGKPLLYGRGESQYPAKLESKVAGVKFEWLLYLLGFVGVAICWFLVQNQAVVGTLLGIAGALLVTYVMFTAVVKLPPVDRDRIFAAMILIFGSILFWALFEQAGSSLNLLTDRMVDREIAGIDVKASMFQSINAIYIVLLAPVFAMVWTWLGRRGLEPSTGAKFGLAMIQLGAGFLVLVFGVKSVGLGNMTPVVFIFLIYLLHTTGELCISPVGLSAMNRLAPASLASVIMGTWFFASAAGNFAAGLIAEATGSGSLETGEKEMVPGSEAAIAYMSTVTGVYTKIGWIAVGVGVVIILISPLIKKLMHLDSLQDSKLT